MILLIDNYDSFTYNLAQYLGQFSPVQVLRNDAENLFDEANKAKGLVFFSFPDWPADAGKMKELIQIFADKKPILGICLGHQAIAEVFGGQLRLAKTVMHGKQSQMRVEGNSPFFNGFQGDVEIMRYHSIVIDEMPKDFIVTARTTDDDEIMAIQHKELPIFGLQFHPESIGSPEGLQMIEQFVREVVR